MTRNHPRGVATFFYPPAISSLVGDTTVGIERDAFGPWWSETTERAEFTISSIEPSVTFREVTGTLRAGECLARDVTIELRSDSETLTTTVHLEPGESQDFALALASETSGAHLVVGAPGAVCTNADKSVSTVALRDAKAS